MASPLPCLKAVSMALPMSTAAVVARRVSRQELRRSSITKSRMLGKYSPMGPSGSMITL